MRPRISIRGFVCPSVGPLVGPSVRPSVTLSSKPMKNGHLRILNDSDSAGRGRKRDKEEGGTRRKEGRGRRDEEKKVGPGPVMVSDTLCPAVHILGI